jgi:hypothetical protein
MSSSESFGNPLRKFKLVFLGEQSGNEKNFDTKKKKFTVMQRKFCKNYHFE